MKAAGWSGKPSLANRCKAKREFEHLKGNFSVTDMKNTNRLINESVTRLFEEVLWSNLKNPLRAYYLLKVLRRQKKAALKRLDSEAGGLHVPPAILISVTDRCNIRCQGCFPLGRHALPRIELDERKLRSIFAEAQTLGISLILLIGGEPLVRREMLEIPRDFPDIVFPLFTNGLLIDERILEKMAGVKNLIPIISLDGFRRETDRRRGEGVYDRLLNVIARIHQRGLFWGASFMVTAANWEVVTDHRFVKLLTASGCKVFFYVEYNPTEDGPQEWVLSADQRAVAMGAIESLRFRIPATFIAFPGDEEKFGGCLSAGRGFVHISPDGHIEPCPFLPYSDTSLNEASLAQGLQSEFFKLLRERQTALPSSKGGCSLQAGGEWVGSLLLPSGCKKQNEERGRKRDRSTPMGREIAGAGAGFVHPIEILEDHVDN